MPAPFFFFFSSGITLMMTLLLLHPSNSIFSRTTCVSRYHTHTHTQPFNGLWSGTTRVGRYQKKHSPTHTHPAHRTSFIIFLHLQRSTASAVTTGLEFGAVHKTDDKQLLWAAHVSEPISRNDNVSERVPYMIQLGTMQSDFLLRSEYIYSDGDVISVPVGFRRHLVGKTPINVFSLGYR